MARVKCPVCGNDVVMGRGQPDGVCSNCGNSVSSRSAHSRSPGQVPPGSGCQLRLAMVAGLGVLVAVAGAVLFFIMAREGPVTRSRAWLSPGLPHRIPDQTFSSSEAPAPAGASSTSRAA